MAHSPFSRVAAVLVAVGVGGAFGAFLPACKHAGTSVLLTVSAQPPLENVTSLHLSLTTPKRSRTYDVPITATLDSLRIGIRIPDDVTGDLTILVEARAAEATIASAMSTLTLAPGRSLDASVVLGEVFPDLIPVDLTPPPDLESCGNGAVDPGETCDPGLSSTPCPSSAADCDDNTPTTIDTITGDRCTRACLHTPIPVTCVADPSGTGCGPGLSPVKCGAALPSAVTSFSEDASYLAPENALTLDGMRATAFVDEGKTTGVLSITGFGFALPNGIDPIDGIEVKIDHNTIAATVTAVRVGLYTDDMGGSAANTSIGATWDTQPLTYGSATAAWSGGVVNSAQINSPSFGLELVLQNSGALASVNIDAVTITVHYAENGVAQSVTRTGTIAQNRPWSKPFATPEAIRNTDTQSAHIDMTASQITETLIGHGYTYQLPDSATIRGIEVAVARVASVATRVRDRRVQLWKQLTAPEATNRASATEWGAAPTTIFYGGPTDLWGTTWTPADINASTFGAGIAVEYLLTGGTCAVDVESIKTTVYACIP